MGINPQNPQPPFAEPGKQLPREDIEQPVPTPGTDVDDDEEAYDDEFEDEGLDGD
ncbi:MAG TPA: hypothetical protein VFJ04_02940 [Rhodanobacteraceae bacterium]|jgi:hypothetical protein|nr:hypothetical protein [Rhodanobacteraceae bacterium]